MTQSLVATTTCLWFNLLRVCVCCDCRVSNSLRTLSRIRFMFRCRRLPLRFIDHLVQILSCCNLGCALEIREFATTPLLSVHVRSWRRRRARHRDRSCGSSLSRACTCAQSTCSDIMSESPSMIQARSDASDSEQELGNADTLQVRINEGNRHEGITQCSDTTDSARRAIAKCEAISSC